jgi:AbrB family looped-hinge helix DNA binding protein
MHITTKGQVTIPIELREELGLLPDTEVEFERDGDTVRIRKATHRSRRGKAVVDALRGRGDVALSTDEIMAMTRGEA